MTKPFALTTAYFILHQFHTICYANNTEPFILNNIKYSGIFHTSQCVF